jgi:phage shock protein PspC (stress-responsive transcriptional regulator)
MGGAGGIFRGVPGIILYIICACVIPDYPGPDNYPPGGNQN